MMSAILKRFAGIDVLVNCASLYESKPLEQVTADDVRRHFEANVLGTFLCSRIAGLAMVKQPEGGLIVNFTDWAEARPYLNYGAYFASKGAIPTLTRCLAVELGTRNPRVRVNCISPGPVLYPEDMPEAEKEHSIRSTLVKHAGSPHNISQAVLALIENDFITGVTLPVDGGRTIYAAE
jgi:pteridine reductase